MSNESSLALSFDLKSLPVLSKCKAGELVRLLPRIEEHEYPAQHVLFTADLTAEYLYYIVEGKIRLTSKGKNSSFITNGFLGEEGVVGLTHYLGEAVCETATKILVFPVERVKSTLASNAGAIKEFNFSLISHYTEETVTAAKPDDKKEKSTQDRASKWEIIGWSLAILLPFISWHLGIYYDLEIKARLFLVVFASITVMWVFRLIAEFIPCILGVLALLVLGVAPASEVLQGFSSGEFFMAMSIFGVGAVLVTSGLTFRCVLLMLRYIPPSPFFHSLAMLFAGLALTPVLPSANGRVGLASPIMIDMLDALGYTPKGPAANALVVETFTGFPLFASVFLTSKPINFVVYGLLPTQVQEAFQWGGWLTAALVSGMVMMLLSITFMLGFFRGGEKSKLSTSQIDAQLKLLGPLSSLEWTALAAVGIFIFGTAISSIHKVDPPWVALAVLTILLAVDALKQKEFHEKVDWSFVLYLAGLIGLVKTMSVVGIESLISQKLAFVGPLMRTNFSLFVLVLFLSVGIVRLIVPNNATIAMFCTILLPIAQTNGINPWIIGYMVLTFSDGWIFPYQCTYYLLFLQLTKKKDVYCEKTLLKFTLLTNLFRIAAIYASLPYWRWLGVI